MTQIKDLVYAKTIINLEIFSASANHYHIFTFTIGMDLRMTPYSCLATGNQVGIIEFVHNAKTVYNIQRQANRFAAMQFDSSQLYKWIKEVSQKVWYIERININVPSIIN